MNDMRASTWWSWHLPRRTLAVWFSLAAFVLAEEISVNVDAYEIGDPPDELFVIDGEFAVVTHEEQGKVLRLPAEPIIEGGLLFGKSRKSAMTAEAKVWASKRGRRSFPRFGLAVHGVAGHRIRVDAARQRLQLVWEDQVIEAVPFLWQSDQWCHLKISLVVEGEKTRIRAWAWMAGEPRPEKPLVDVERAGDFSGQGKASVWGTPFSGKEILFDDLKMSWPSAEPKED